jgi:hypothetical protein
MVSENAVRDLLITCVDNLNTIDDMLREFNERYAGVLALTATRHRHEFYRSLNAACLFDVMARQWYATGDTIRARRCLNDAFRCLDRATYVN